MLLKRFLRLGESRIFTKLEISCWKQCCTSIPEEKPASESSDPEKQHVRIRAQRFKYAMLLSYSGHKYYGMQLQRKSDASGCATIEWHLIEALFKLRLLSKADVDCLGLIDFQRASRTDKGVSAARQICSLILPLGRVSPRFPEDNEFAQTPQSVVAPLNQLLPEDIRVIAVKRVTPKFDAKRYCDGRYYTYTLPTYALASSGQVDLKKFRIMKDRLELANFFLSMYTTHRMQKRNFYNFTRGRLPTDSSCVRYITRCECGQPFLRNGVEFVTVHIAGNSFMFHQIRKMMGLWIAIMRGHVGKELLEACWQPERIHLPLAPSLGLVLNDIYFNGYYKRYGSTHEAVTWEDCEDAIRDFRERHIDSVICDAETNGKSPFPEWLELIKEHTYFNSAEPAEDEATSVTEPGNEQTRKKALVE